MTPRVSIVIPHFDRSDLLREAIDSALLASRGRAEILVVDDGSSTEEWNRIRQYGSRDVRVLRRAENPRGPSRCRNIGAAASRGEYIIFLDSDDVMAPWCIEQRLACADAAQHFDLYVFPVLLFHEKPGDSDQLWNEMGTSVNGARRFASSDPPWHTSSTTWKKSAFDSISGFNERIVYGDDSDLHLRALVSGLRVATFADSLPDVFVRRSALPRITNSLGPDMVESRRVRLREGTAFLKGTDNRTELLTLMEAQHFVEAEFLLFNLPAAREPIRRVLAIWESEFSLPLLRRLVVRAYLAVALACRTHAYLLLRLARRAAMVLLPSAYFPRGSAAASASAGTMEQVRTLLHESGTPHA